MLVIPAVDVRGGACVQGTGAGGSEVRNPVAAAEEWVHAGFRRIHVVDVDAAMGRGSSERIVQAIVSDVAVPVQVGGGVRDADAIDRLLDAGADRVVVGSRAVEEPDWLAEITDAYPARVIVAAGVRQRQVTTRGRMRRLPHDILDVVDELNAFRIAGILLTSEHGGQPRAAGDLALLEDVVERSTVPVIAAGGATTLADLRALEHRGVSAVVVGSALYTGALDARQVALEFAE